MLFNSAEFIYVFLPVMLIGFLLLGSRSRGWALGWLIVASLVYYAWWRPLNVAIIVPSILINFAIARSLLGLTAEPDRAGLAKLVLIAGITFNVAFLGYFKYVNFLTIASNDVFGTTFVLEHVILPLGISFITFQKIAFLIDVHGRRVTTFSIRDFLLFVLFFPQLIAGPIVHFREMMPQFERLSGRVDTRDIAVGLTLFVIGLFKKVVFADGIAEHVSPIYAAAGSGAGITLIDAWIAAVGFTLQIYFDFSAYSDMALGLARLVGIRLPMNFDSPLKASSIIDFWLRWHMTLTRFLTAYLYNPLVLALTRRRAAKGLKGVGGRNTTFGSFVQLLAAPTIFTMFVSGLWHGAGYLFILWGLLHGVYLTINHAWRTVIPRGWRNRDSYARVMGPVGWLLTFLAVAVAMVLFRAPSIPAATDVLAGLIGINGVNVPQVVWDQLGPLAGILSAVTTVHVAGSAMEIAMGIGWTVSLLMVALLLPNALDLLSRFNPAVDFPARREIRFGLAQTLRWQPSLAWGIGVATLALVAVYRLGGRSEFLYWQF